MAAASALIRRALPADARRIAEVHVLSWQAAYRGLLPADFLASLSIERREEQWRQSLADPAAGLLVCEREGGLVGFASFGSCRDADSRPGITGEIHAIYLLEPCWGIGLGKALLDEMLGGLRARGFEEVVLWVLRENRRAIDFYRRQGFAFDGSGRTLSTRAGVRMSAVRYRRRI